MRPSIVVFASIIAAGAWAQSDPYARGIDLVPMKLTPSLSSGLVLDGAELEVNHAFLLQALLDFNVGIMSLKVGNAPVGDLIPFRADLHLMGAYQVHPRIEVAADLPITLGQVNNFRLLDEQGFPQPSPHVAGLGAPRIQGRFQILRQSEVPIVGLVGIAEVRFPIGDKDAFLSDRGFVFAPRLAVERTFGPVRVLANLGYRFRTAPGQFLNLFVGHEFTLGAGGILALPEYKQLRRNELILELNLATPVEAPFTFNQADVLKTPFELMVGARTVLSEHWRLQLSIGKGLGAPGYGHETIRFSVSVAYVENSPPDRDGDSIPDVVDRCPDVPGLPELDGCPPQDPDRDGDTVPDRVDLCPDVPGPPQLQGCPDRDGDQIPDIADKCPDQPGPPEREGCPPPVEEEPVVLESERIRINNQILFEFGSAKLDPASYKLLDEVGLVLSTHAEVGPVLIEGHTDSIGSRPFNLDLSRRRAKSVEDYLVSKGINRARLKSAGFGFDRPVVPNDTPLNRAKNRRTEFKLVDAKPVTKP